MLYIADEVFFTGTAAEALRNGRDHTGNPLIGTPDLFLGATCNPGATNFDAEVENTRRKIDAGAQMLHVHRPRHWIAVGNPPAPSPRPI